jgi:hypothetical protein
VCRYLLILVLLQHVGDLDGGSAQGATIDTVRAGLAARGWFLLIIPTFRRSSTLMGWRSTLIPERATQQSLGKGTSEAPLPPRCSPI